MLSVSQIQLNNSTKNIGVTRPCDHALISCAKMCAKDSVSFRGHVGGEGIRLGKKLIPLIQETAFFRQFTTLDFVKNYVEKTFKNKKNIKILDGACSTGEETYSIAMLFDKSDKILDITGFDLGKNAIRKAKGGIFTIATKPKNSNPLAEAYNDAFLAFPTTEHMSKKQKSCIDLFNSYFEEKPISIKERLTNLFLPKVDAQPQDSKMFRVRKDKKNKCSFTYGNILNLDPLAKDGTVDVLLFRNALYHLITTNVASPLRKPLPEKKARPILEKIFEGIHKKLGPKGIFVMGTDENSQSFNHNLAQTILVEKGFRPLKTIYEYAPCVWQKVD